MTKKKRAVLIVIAVLVLALAASCLWYTRPMTLAQLTPEVADHSPCEEIHVSASERSEDGAPASYVFTLTSNDPAFDQLPTLFEDQTYRRSLQNLLPGGSQSHSSQPGDFQWIVILEGYGQTILDDGSTVSGTMLQFSNFFGSLSVNNVGSGDDWQVTVPSQDQWLTEVMEVIRQFPPEG